MHVASNRNARHSEQGGRSASRICIALVFALVLVAFGDMGRAANSHARETRSEAEGNRQIHERMTRHESLRDHHDGLMSYFEQTGRKGDRELEEIRNLILSLQEFKQILDKSKNANRVAEARRHYRGSLDRLKAVKFDMERTLNESNETLDDLNRWRFEIERERINHYGFYSENTRRGLVRPPSNLNHTRPDLPRDTGQTTQRDWDRAHARAASTRTEARSNLRTLHNQLKAAEDGFRDLSTNQQKAYLRRNDLRDLNMQLQEQQAFVESFELQMSLLQGMRDKGQPVQPESIARLEAERPAYEQRLAFIRQHTDVPQQLASVEAEIQQRSQRLVDALKTERDLHRDLAASLRQVALAEAAWHASIKAIPSDFAELPAQATYGSTSFALLHQEPAPAQPQEAANQDNYQPLRRLDRSDLVYVSLPPEGIDAIRQSAPEVRSASVDRDIRTGQRAPTEARGPRQRRQFGTPARATEDASSASTSATAATSSTAARAPAGAAPPAAGSSGPENPPRRAGVAATNAIAAAAAGRGQAGLRPVRDRDRGRGRFPPSGADGSNPRSKQQR